MAGFGLVRCEMCEKCDTDFCAYFARFGDGVLVRYKGGHALRLVLPYNYFRTKGLVKSSSGSVRKRRRATQNPPGYKTFKPTKGAENAGELFYGAPSVRLTSLSGTALACCGAKRGQSLHNRHRLHAHPHHPLDQIDNITFVVAVAVGVAGDAAALVGADLILIDHPIQRGTVAEPILEGFHRDIFQRQCAVPSEPPVRVVNADQLAQWTSLRKTSSREKETASELVG